MLICILTLALSHPLAPHLITIPVPHLLSSCLSPFISDYYLVFSCEWDWHILPWDLLFLPPSFFGSEDSSMIVLHKATILLWVVLWQENCWNWVIFEAFFVDYILLGCERLFTWQWHLGRRRIWEDKQIIQGSEELANTILYSDTADQYFKLVMCNNHVKGSQK